MEKEANLFSFKWPPKRNHWKSQRQSLYQRVKYPLYLAGYKPQATALFPPKNKGHITQSGYALGATGNFKPFWAPITYLATWKSILFPISQRFPDLLKQRLLHKYSQSCYLLVPHPWFQPTMGKKYLREKIMSVINSRDFSPFHYSLNNKVEQLFT